MKASGNNLKKITDQRLIRNILSKSHKNSDRIMIWTLVNNEKKTLAFSHKAVRKADGELIIQCLNQQVAAREFQNFVTDDQKINIWVPEAGILFQAEIKKQHKNYDLVLSVPDMIAQMERRKDIRLTIEERHKCVLKFAHEAKNHPGKIHSFDKRIHDISAGGLSVIMSKGESDFFNIGDILKPVSIWIGTVEIVVHLEVVNLINIEPNATNGLIYAGNKLCVKYQKISQQDKELIEAYVFKYVDVGNIAA